MKKTQEKYWRWEKMAVVDEFTIQGITCFDRERDLVVIKPDDYVDYDEFSYMAGTKFTDQLNHEWDEQLTLNKRFASCFEDLQDRGVTLRPVELQLEKGKEDNDTWLHVSVVGRVLGIDYQQSEYTMEEYGKGIESIEKLVLNREHIERSGMHIFRLYHCQEWIIVSDTLKQKLQALNINGMRFLPIDG